MPSKKLPPILQVPITITPYSTPISLDAFELLDAEFLEKQRQQTAQYIHEQTQEKLPYLFKYYDIDMSSPYAWRELAHSLAKDHVRGFQVEYPKKRGAKLSWDEIRLSALWYDVTVYTKKKNVSARTACNVLQRQEPWRSWLQNERKLTSRERSNPSKDPILKTLYNKYQLSTKIKMITDFRKTMTESPSSKETIMAFLKLLKSGYMKNYLRKPIKNKLHKNLP